MLNTLLQIGDWQSRGKSKWDRFLERPKVEYEDRKGNKLENYILPVVFDLDKNVIEVKQENLLEFDEKYLSRWRALKIQGGNNKAIYLTVASEKIQQMYKTLFGREGGNSINGELKDAILTSSPEVITADFEELLDRIFKLKSQFWETFKITKQNGTEELSAKSLDEIFNLGVQQRVVLLTAMVKDEKFFGDEKFSLAQRSEYEAFLKKKYLDDNMTNETSKASSTQKLCYASGKLSTKVEGLNLTSRYSLNKMFVEETKNYASNFDKNKFSSNYQVDHQNQEKLDYASDYLLNQGGMRVKIANVDHVIIPQFMANKEIDLEMALDGIKQSKDLLFGFNVLESWVKNIEDETDNIFWLNFLAYESDGNFFKSTENIKDVSNFHFQHIIKTFQDVHWEFKGFPSLPWNKIMSRNEEAFFFNFNSVYSLIPIRKEKEKKNRALALLKTILENRKVKSAQLYAFFSELILCHYYERYRSYTNISPSSRDYFYISVRNSVFKYHAFIEVLKRLNLIDMNEPTNLTPEEKGKMYEQSIYDFFVRMKLNQPQQAMFYLGRMLNAVEFIQKGKKKTVIDKVNFHGMDRDDIQRLRISLVEKAKQYGKTGKLVFTDRKFGELFDFNRWNMNPQEAVFFLLTGYSFGISYSDADKLEKQEELNN